MEQIAVAILALSAGWTAWTMSRRDEPLPAGAARAMPAVARRTPMPDENAYAEIVRRSLFVPARRAEFGSAGGAGSIGGHVLRGVVSGAGGGVAILEPVSGGPARRLRIGGMIGGFRIAAVEEGAIVLERDGRQRRLAIDETPRAASPTMTAAAVPEAPSPFESTPDEIEQ